jgi:hypothetical protein
MLPKLSMSIVLQPFQRRAFLDFQVERHVAEQGQGASLKHNPLIKHRFSPMYSPSQQPFRLL